MDEKHLLFYIIKLKDFTQFMDLIAGKYPIPTKENFHIVHLDFNLFGISIHGQQLLDTYDIGYDVIFTNIPFGNLIDFFDYENKKFKPDYIFDFSPDYNEQKILLFYENNL